MLSYLLVFEIWENRLEFLVYMFGKWALVQQQKRCRYVLRKSKKTLDDQLNKLTNYSIEYIYVCVF